MEAEVSIRLRQRRVSRTVMDLLVRMGASVFFIFCSPGQNIPTMFKEHVLYALFTKKINSKGLLESTYTPR